MSGQRFEPKEENFCALFIVGTDTGVGKTLVCGLLLDFFRRQGRRAITQKWVQTGAADDLAEHDTRALPAVVPPAAQERRVCYRFALPASPHLAAAAERRKISAIKIRRNFRELAADYETVIVEGSGGVLVPYNRTRYLIEIAASLHLPVLLVAENRVGAINHTLLSVEALRRRGLSLAGILFTQCHPPQHDEEAALANNPVIVRALSGEPVLGVLEYSADREVLRARSAAIFTRFCSRKGAGALRGIKCERRIV
ncbi:MAG: dethiobiotin synthase [Candidatus Omnitrophica bacterium]|nr:dethiobiotin synthase [Candidatus Omnitrophota bacterium]